MRDSQMPRFVRAGLLGVLVLTLAACASNREFTTQVTSFQQWPADATGAHYRFDRQDGRNLEQQTYVGFVRNNMFRTGLIEALGRESARFDVGFSIGAEQRQQLVQRETGNYDLYPTFGFGMGFPHGYYGNPFFSNVGIAMAPRYEMVPVPYQRYSLTVSIRDRQRNGAEVYRATALGDSRERSLPEIMPYLAASVFDGFPGNNGQVRKVEFERQKAGSGMAPVTVKKP